MISIAICDDSLIERKMLKKIVNSLMKEKGIEFQIVSFENGWQLMESYQLIRYQLIFLDIMMEGLNGIDIGKMIREQDYNAEIIYCTSSQDFLLASYEVFAMGYVLKPYDILQIDRLLEFYFCKHDIDAQKYLTVTSNFVERKIYYREIIFVESQDKVVIFHTNTSGEIKVYDKLSNVEEKLTDQKFLRCHQSYIINLDFAARMEENEFVTITNSMIPIRRRDRRHLREKYWEYRGNQHTVLELME